MSSLEGFSKRLNALQGFLITVDEGVVLLAPAVAVGLAVPTLTSRLNGTIATLMVGTFLVGMGHLASLRFQPRGLVGAWHDIRRMWVNWPLRY